MKKLYICTLFLIIYTIPLNAGILYINYRFVKDLIEKQQIKIRERALLKELKDKLHHNPRYINENTDLLEDYVSLYQKHTVGKRTIKFLLSRKDGRAQYRDEFSLCAPFITDIINKKRSRSHVLNPLYDVSPDYSDEFMEIEIPADWPRG